MIKDVMELHQLALDPYKEDAVLVCSKFNPTPTIEDCLVAVPANQEAILFPTDSKFFNVNNMYFGIYSMSGIHVRVAFGFQKDAYPTNACLMRKNGTSEADKKLALREKLELEQKQVEESIFNS